MINKKQEWNQNKEQGFPRAMIDNFLDEKNLFESCTKSVYQHQKVGGL